MSETKKVRHLVVKYCTGQGIDVGCGGDKITPNCIGFDLTKNYVDYGQSTIDERGDGRNLSRWKNKTFDFLYSSHLIEDFPKHQTSKVLSEWWRVIKKGGYMILVFPDQQCYANEFGGFNPHHSVPNMGMEYMLNRLREALSRYTIEFTSDREIDYNVIIVIRKP